MNRQDAKYAKMKMLILLPLTPALSRRERENCRQPVGERRFPLLGGEGQGEGQCMARFLNDSAAHVSSRTSEACGKRPFFGLNLLKIATELTKSVTYKGNSVTKLLNFVPNKGNFATNKGLVETKLLNVVTKQHCFVPTKGNVVTKLLNFVSNQGYFASKQFCFTMELPKSKAFITPKIAKNGVLEAEMIKKRQFLGAMFTQPLVTNANAGICRSRGNEAWVGGRGRTPYVVPYNAENEG